MYREEKSTSPLTIIIRIAMVLGGLILGFVISRAFIIPYKVAGDSMSPNFNAGKRIFILKHTTPHFGDIVLMRSPVISGKVFIKRIIGVAGDSIEIKNQVIYRNNDKLRLNWKTAKKDQRNLPMSFSFRDTMPLVKLFRNEYFVINDNLDDSYDSRTFGKIQKDLIIGRFLYSF